MSLCDAMRHRGISLATTAAASAATFALFATAVGIDHSQFDHGFHLLSNRRLSINWVKKIGVQRASVLQSYCLLVNNVYQFFRCSRFWGELDHQLTTAHHDIFLVQRIERLLAFLADVDQTRIAQNGKVMGNGGLREADLLDDLING